MPRRGAVFVFEGPDGVGKTTLVGIVQKLLAKSKESVLVASFPGRGAGTLGAHIYDLHHCPSDYSVLSLSPDALQILHIAAHVDTIQTVIRPHVEKGGILLLDRYWWSTWVYGRLSGVRTLALERMIALEQSYWHGLMPEAVFLITRPAGALDPQLRGNFLVRSQEYELLADRESSNSPVARIDNSGDVTAVAAEIVSVIKEVPSRATRIAKRSDLLATNRRQQRLPIRDVPCLPFDRPSADGMSSVPLLGSNALTIWSKLAPAKPTIVFDTYWQFASERQNIFFNRFHGRPRPWTDDPILDRYKFTNAYRASDRVSQYLIRHVIYSGSQVPRELFFRIILFKLFNRIETWERLVAVFGELSARDFKPSRYDEILTTAMQAGETLYSGAYIMPSGDARWRQDRKHRMHLQLLEYMLSLHLPERIARSRSMQEVFELLKSVPTIGDFLAYQFATDLNYSTLVEFDEREFVVPGPGAKDGIRKCFSTLGGLTEADLIRFICDRQEDEFRSRSLRFQYLFERPLQLIDCQNLFCEVDKYARVYHPDVRGKTGRSRIKQRFRASPGQIEYWYPPKWGLNGRIAQELHHVS